MFHFDGAYKRSPIQNLGGSSVETDRQTLIKKAQVERKRREEIRKEEVSSLKIQSFYRQVNSSSSKIASSCR
jgi:ubiquitin-protein ligase E3 C